MVCNVTKNQNITPRYAMIIHFFFPLEVYCELKREGEEPFELSKIKSYFNKNDSI